MKTQASRKHAIDALFHPRNVVLVGASDRTDHWSMRVRDNLKRFGFPGRVLPVNPNRREIWGEPCFPNFGALPEPPDHLAIFTPAETTVAMLREGGAAGARSATIFAAGFGEGGGEAGRRLGARLRAALAETGIAAVGPNCMGLGCGASRFATIPDETLQELAPSPVALVAQSGAMCAQINRVINDLGLQLGYLASCGSQIGATVGDFIDYLADCPEVKVILCYIEAIPDAANFLDAARRARANGKTVVALKIGGSEGARAAALAHTGSLAGRAEVFEAFASAAGIVRALSLEDAIEAVEFLARAPLPAGGRIAAVTNSGAQRSLITEAADRTGATLAALSEATIGALSRTLGHADIANPLDTKRTIPNAQYVGCLNALIDAHEVDIVLAVEELPLQVGVERRVANLRSLETSAQRAAERSKTLAVLTPLLANTTDYGRTVRADLPHVPVLRETERSLRVLKTLADAGRRALHSGALFAPPADSPEARRWRARAAKLDGPTALNEVESKALLGAYGIAMPLERLAQTAAEAEQAAQAIGYPVVLKGVCAAIAHKSDAGLVILGVADRAAVREAAATLARRAEKIGVRLDGLLVAKQITGGAETVLGVNRDVEMGAVVMFGLGGIWLELFKDVAFAPATLDRAQALAMVNATRAGALIKGYRGAALGDLDALTDALLNLGRLARDLGDIIEAVDINPFLVCERGAFALDGLVVLRPPKE